MLIETTEPIESTPHVNPMAEAMKKWQSNLGDVSPISGPQNPPAPVKDPILPDAAGGDGKPPLAAPVAEKPAAVAPPVKDPDDDEATWPRSAKDWKELKKAGKEREAKLAKERDETKAELESVRKQIAESQKSGPSPELEALKKEKEELSRALQVTAVTNHPQFKKYFDGKTQSQLALAKSIVGDAHADTISKILTLPEGEYRDRQLESAMETLTPLQQNRMGSVINALSELNQEKQQAIANAEKDYEVIQTNNKAQQEQEKTQRKQGQEKAFEEVLGEFSGTDFFKTVDGSVDHNAGVEKRITLAKSLLFGQNDPKTLARAVAYATIAPDLANQNRAFKAEVERLTEQVKALTAANPTASTGTAPNPTGVAAKVAPKMGQRPSEVSANWAKGLTEAMNGR